MISIKVDLGKAAYIKLIEKIDVVFIYLQNNELNYQLQIELLLNYHQEFIVDFG